MWTTIVTPSTPSTKNSSAPLVVFPVLMITCHTTLAQVVHESVIFTSCCTCVVDLFLFDLSFYFYLSFPVLFLSSVLMYPDLQTDLYNLDSVENNLRHSAKGSLDAYDVTHSLTESTCKKIWYWTMVIYWTWF